MKKAIVIVFLLVAIGYGGFSFINNYIYQQKQKGNRPPPVNYQGVLTGEYVCLPHKDTKGPQTLECAFGLKTDSGSYYGLDFGQTQPTNITTGNRIKVTGKVTPIEALSAEQKYPIEGIIRITDVKKQ